jgi:hypothetical protein
MSFLKQLFVIAMLSMLCSFSPAGYAQEAVSASSANSSPTTSAENPFVQTAGPLKKPTSLKVKIGIALVVAAAAAGALWISMRVWRAANLFDRQYQFPPPQTAALRLGANRSGGHLATIKFGDDSVP